MIWWTSLAPWEFEFPFPGSLISTCREDVGIVGRDKNLFDPVCLQGRSINDLVNYLHGTPVGDGHFEDSGTLTFADSHCAEAGSSGTLGSRTSRRNSTKEETTTRCIKTKRERKRESDRSDDVDGRNHVI